MSRELVKLYIRDNDEVIDGNTLKVDIKNRRKKGVRLATVTAIILSLVYAVIATALVTPLAVNWDADYQVYISVIETNYFEQRFDIFLHSTTLLHYIDNAQSLLFYYVLNRLGVMGLSPAMSLAAISIISAFIVSFYVISHSKNRCFLLFLATPLLLDIIFFQVRNGFALSLFIAGLLVLGRFRATSILLFLVAIIMHYSLVIMVAILFIVKFHHRYNIIYRDLLTLVFVNKLAGLITMSLFIVMTLYFHRYLLRTDILNEASWTGLVFFAVLMMIYLLNGKKYVREYQFQYLLSVILFFLYMIFPQTLRLMAMALPFHITAFSDSRKTLLSFSVLALFLVFNYLNWSPLWNYLA